MRGTKILTGGLAVLLLACLTGVVSAAETVESLVKKVDAKLYYPQTQGMRSLQADVKSSWLQQQLQQAPEARNARLTFYWAQPYRLRFRITGVPASLADQARQVERQLSMWGERIVPKPLGLALADYKCKLSENEKAYVIDARTTAPSAVIWAMRYTIDKKSFLPTKWRLTTNEWEADVDIQYNALPTGKYYATVLKAKANGTDLKIQRTHKAIGPYFLVETLTVTFTGDDGTERSSALTLSNHRFNQPIPPGTFPAEGP